ncbi:MAG: hypothetical protein IPK16_12910 [Anaerolineales bacterium]|nr:hypothetical protein [Anaerolineales bacterium]
MKSKNAVIAWIGLFMMFAAVLIGAAWGPMVASAQDTATEDTGHPPIVGAEPESCTTCHGGAGARHQEAYDELYQDGVIQVTDLAYTFTPTGTTTVTFKMTKDGEPFDGRDADQLAIYFSPYADGQFGFEPALERVSLKGDLAYDGAGGLTSTLVSADVPDFTNTTGIVIVYGADEQVGSLPARIRQVKYPFEALLQMGEGVDYVSAANTDGCKNCHTDPYLKHGFINSQVGNDPATDFYTCKACHMDNGEGGHFEWQLMVDDPALAAAYLADDSILTDEQKAKYAYTTSVMNDVHMSHAMEFPYPQSMANCVTCHEGKLDQTLADENFKTETCQSCHALTGSEEEGTAETSLDGMMYQVSDHDDVELTDSCTSCHKDGGEASTFRQIHSGYNELIFASEGVKYSDAISVTIDSAAFDGGKLDIAFSAHQDPDLGFDVSTITPTVMIGLYGGDTKDLLIGAHERLTDDNADGAIDSKDKRALEWVVGEEHPRFTLVSAGDGKWEVVADMSTWTDLVDNGKVKRVEIAVMPTLLNDDEEMLALNAPSRTFDLGANDFADDFYPPIAKVVDGCNDCHEALATTFHEPDHGGNLVVCRMCHVTKSGGSHLELQSRSLDSYVHAIHSFQAFDIGDIDFEDPVAAMHYGHHTEFPYPTHGIDCLSCHVEGAFEVPDQTRSLPGILSATDALSGTTRAIGTIPSVVTGPAARACGGCHRAELINEDDVNGLVSLNQHLKQGGTSVPVGDKPQDTLQAVIDEIMSYFD